MQVDVNQMVPVLMRYHLVGHLAECGNDFLHFFVAIAIVNKDDEDDDNNDDDDDDDDGDDDDDDDDDDDNDGDDDGDDDDDDEEEEEEEEEEEDYVMYVNTIHMVKYKQTDTVVIVPSVVKQTLLACRLREQLKPHKEIKPTAEER
ncbi:hypothetical protein DPMN_066075 [Dreissena polymorpha]|uniref:Uncharacterized protein n=1 Tax=Dreissena polymorpha TaxID=45954 RepID=A0A9D3YUR3_DREPO|nr:hypothetical protein DPMN_066075 [Dreissena polymorpha]